MLYFADAAVARTSASKSQLHANSSVVCDDADSEGTCAVLADRLGAISFTRVGKNPAVTGQKLASIVLYASAKVASSELGTTDRTSGVLCTFQTCAAAQEYARPER